MGFISDLYSYQQGLEISRHGYPFYALIQAAMRQADDQNLHRLKMCWPDVYEDLYARYHAPGGLLPHEQEPPKGG